MNKTQEINNYYKKLESYKHYSSNESSIRNAFIALLDSYALEQDLILVPELAFDRNNIPDGTVKDKFRFDFGYWEAKDTKDNLDKEIAKKIAKGYPTDNIIFEDSERAVLIQNKETVFDINMQNSEKLGLLLDSFFVYEKPEITEFNRAIEQFRDDIPQIIEPIKDKISSAAESNQKFKVIYQEFVDVCKRSIDKNITQQDIFEMLLQHILTEDIFKVVFNDSDFHVDNNIAKTLNKLEQSVISKAEKRTLFTSIRYYYAAIKSHSLALTDYKEKQKFLNTLYENFYKAYNPKKADKLGIVYTPLEIVDFMINAVDSLVYEHFDKTLADENVKILDPATGTGTFLTQIIDYIPVNSLKQKYLHELFANEISILPYYIANLNLEYLYQQKMNEYQEFENISFVDTLELNASTKGQKDLMGLFSDENLLRVKRQEQAEINVVIGNPPYNANQQNENDNNKNKEAKSIDARIKETYVKSSNAQKTKVYDMYSRFYRWASDRIVQDGMIAFITNSSFIDSKTFDGFRKTVFEEFNEIYVIDLGGNVRKNPKISGTKNNVFGIQTGVAIMFLIKKADLGKCKLFYLNPFADVETKENKLSFLKYNNFNKLKSQFELIIPDKKYNWLNQTNNDWDDLIPMGTKECKLNKTENAIFKLFSLGVVTNRDAWVYDFDKINLEKKVEFNIKEYRKYLKDYKQNKPKNINDFVHLKNSIKWTRHLKNQLSKEKIIKFNKDNIYNSLYRPFNKKFIYFDNYLNEMQYQQPKIFPNAKSENLAITLNSSSYSKYFPVLANSTLIDLGFLVILGRGGSQSFPLHTYAENNEKQENITNYGLKAFQNHYSNKTVTKKDIFHYCYAVLHSPTYREKYAINLKQDLPRIPFYQNFTDLVKIGAELIDLHVNFEQVEPYNLTELTHKSNKPNNPKLKLSKAKDEILIDEITTLTNFPPEALNYKLGNRSAIEWILDGYKEKKIKDPTVNKMFNNYKFSDYKPQVIDLLKRVTTVSLKTLELIDKLKNCANK
ncbi:N-6 DNA methylase [Candidatus Halobeggiatoa sp. HSG11]|nr:N-6 DNA methylase [Candidatus Halobeggiatoa sp. HSG11]